MWGVYRLALYSCFKEQKKILRNRYAGLRGVFETVQMVRNPAKNCQVKISWRNF